MIPTIGLMSDQSAELHAIRIKENGESLREDNGHRALGIFPNPKESCDSTSTILKVSHATSDVETVYRQRRSFCIRQENREQDLPVTCGTNKDINLSSLTPSFIDFERIIASPSTPF